jgi:hypothetical protein
MQARGMPTLGSDSYRAANPSFGAVFTYHLAEVPQTQREARRASERDLRERGEDVPFPGWDRLRAEALERGPRVLLMVRDAQGEPVRWIEGPASAGVHRVSWDLRRPAPDPVELATGGFRPPWAGEPQGPLAPPGTYSVELMLVTAVGAESLGTPQTFTVKPTPTTPPGTDFVALAAFQQETAELARQVSGANDYLGELAERLRYMRAALLRTPRAPTSLSQRMDELEATVDGLRIQLSGDRIRGRLNEPTAPSISGRVGRVANGHWGTRQMPTATQRRNLEIARDGFATVGEGIQSLETDVAQLERDLEAAGAPWTRGRRGGG